MLASAGILQQHKLKFLASHFAMKEVAIKMYSNNIK